MVAHPLCAWPCQTHYLHSLSLTELLLIMQNYIGLTDEEGSRRLGSLPKVTRLVTEGMKKGVQV